MTTARVDNDQTLELLNRTAVSQAQAGADIVAPSDMMDGRVCDDPPALDDEGLTDTPIMAYSAKFASAFYGPFREAADSAPAFGDRRGYQMDPANGRRGAARGAARRQEGADILIVKPALPYLDVSARDQGRHGAAGRGVQRLRRVFDAEGRGGRGLAGRASAVLEALTSIRRAGRRHDHHLPRQGGGRVASVDSRHTDGIQDANAGNHGPKLRSRKDGAAIALDDLDKRLLNLMQGQFPIAARPYEHVAQQAGVSEPEVMQRVQRLLDERIIRQVTPIFDTRALGYESMLVAAKVDPDNPWRAANIINAHPGVSHNYLRNHEFNIWFTIATEPDSSSGCRARSTCWPARRAPSRSVSCRR